MIGEYPVPVCLKTDWVLSQFSDNRQQAIEFSLAQLPRGKLPSCSFLLPTSSWGLPIFI